MDRFIRPTPDRHDRRNPPPGAARRAGWAVAAVLLAAAPAAAQDRIILRDARVVSGTVTAVTPDGVDVDQGGGKTVALGWDEVEAGTVGAKQAEFDQQLAAVGDPLFRVRQRLKAGDFRELLDPAERLFPAFKDRATGTAEAVCQATALARLAAGKREAAVEPFLCAAALRGRPGVVPPPRFQPANGRSAAATGPYGTWPALPPVWFDPAAAKDALPRVAARLKAWPGGKAPPGAHLYAATLAATAGDTAAAAAHEKELGAAGTDWAPVLAAQREVEAGPAGAAVERLERKLDALKEPVRAVALYWVGVGRVRAADPAAKKRAVVTLLHLPALYADAAPDVAAAGLYHAAVALDELTDARGAVAVRSELVTGFPQTVHAARLAAGAAPAKKDDPPPPAAKQ
jgi:hypothetical protein